MPVSIHKILDHGAEIVPGAILASGESSEEAMKSRSKDRKYFRGLSK